VSVKTGLIAGVLLLAAVASATAAKIPAGTQIQIRLTAEVNSSTAKAGQAFGAIVIVPVVVNDRIAMAAGVTLAGHVTDATAAAQPDDQAMLSLAFDEIHDARGVKAAVAAKLASIDNASEKVDDQGAFKVSLHPRPAPLKLDEGINKVAEKYPSFADLLGTVKQGVLKAPDANIDYKPGVEMTIELTKPMEWNGAADAPNVSAISPQEGYFSW
jgi:hypothetical protein